jgi:hypothetical protein
MVTLDEAILEKYAQLNGASLSAVIACCKTIASDKKFPKASAEFLVRIAPLVAWNVIRKDTINFGLITKEILKLTGNMFKIEGDRDVKDKVNLSLLRLFGSVLTIVIAEGGTTVSQDIMSGCIKVASRALSVNNNPDASKSRIVDDQRRSLDIVNLVKAKSAMLSVLYKAKLVDKARLDVNSGYESST